MRFPIFISPSYTPSSIAAETSRTVNFIAEFIESGKGKNPDNLFLLGRPGLTTLLTVTSATAIKAIFYETRSGRIFCVSLRGDASTRLVEVFLNVTQTDRV